MLALERASTAAAQANRDITAHEHVIVEKLKKLGFIGRALDLYAPVAEISHVTILSPAGEAEVVDLEAARQAREQA